MSEQPDYWARQQILWSLPVTCASERLLMLALNYHQGDRAEAWPSQETLAGELGLKVRQTRTLIERLRKRGWISVRRGWPNRYSICWHHLAAIGTSVPDAPKRNRHSTAAKHSSLNIKINTHGTDAVSSKRNGWNNGGISADELSDPDAIDRRFGEAVERGYCHTGDRLRFHTLARHVADSSTRNAGALFTTLLKDKGWPGSDGQEDAARAAIRSIDDQSHRANGHGHRLAAVLTADLPAGGGDHD